MSAAAAAIPQTKKTWACFLPRSYFLLDLPGTAHVCLGLILLATKGASPAQLWAHVSRRAFAKTANVGYDEVGKALRSLKDKGLIRIKREQGRAMYQAVLEAPREHTAIGRCLECGETGLIELAKGTVPTPRGYLTDLPRRVSDAVRRLVGVVMAKTCQFVEQGDRHTYQVNPQAIPVEDLEWELGRKHSAISETSEQAKKLGLINADRSKGKNTVYSVRLDPLGRFAELPLRKARTVTVSFRRAAGTRGKTTAGKKTIEETVNQLGSENTQPAESTQPGNPDETVLPKLPGYCASCGKFGLKLIITMPAPDDTIPKTSWTHSRAGPGPPQAPKSSAERIVPQDLMEIYVCLARWSRGFAAPPTVDMARAVREALPGCPPDVAVRLLDQRYGKRRHDIHNARMPGILVTIAKQDVGPFWLLSQQHKFDPLNYEEPEPIPAPLSERDRWHQDFARRLEAQKKEERDARKR